MTATPERERRAREGSSFVFWYLGVSSLALVALIVLVAILLFNYGSQTRALEKVTAAQQQSNIQQCQLANVTRMQDIAIWNRLLQVSSVKETPAQKAEVADLERLVRVKDTPRNCAAAYPPG